jgi:hypothetical protein
MTTNAVPGTNAAASLSSILSASRSFAKKTDGDGDAASGGGVQSRGGTLFTALLAALTQFVTSHPAGTAGGTGTPGTTCTTTPGTTTTPATTTTTGATTGTSSGTVPSTLPQDLHVFLHDLFRALRQEGRHRHEDDDSRHSHVPSSPVSTSPVPTPVTTTSTGTVTTPGVIPATAPVTTPTTTPATTTDTGGTTTSPVTAPPGIAQYGQHGLVAELTALIKDLADSSKASGTANKASRVSPGTLADLNAAFAKLIGDLGGTVSGASDTNAVPPATDPSTSASTAAAGTAAAGTTTPATTAAPHPDTSALQSFLTSFLHDLQGNAARAGTLGNGVNVKA